MEINAIQIESVVAPTIQIIEPEPPLNLCACGEESHYGVHGHNDDGIYSIYYCHKCYNKTKKKQDDE